jgi:hypothetical protein
MLSHPNFAAVFPSPFSRSLLNAIRSALTRSAQDCPLPIADTKEENVCCGPHTTLQCPSQTSILLDLRGELRTHSGEVRCDSYHTRTSYYSCQPTRPLLGSNLIAYYYYGSACLVYVAIRTVNATYLGQRPK